MNYQIQFIRNGVAEVIDDTVDAEYAYSLCREYSLAFKYPCTVVREDEPDYIEE